MSVSNDSSTRTSCAPCGDRRSGFIMHVLPDRKTRAGRARGSASRSWGVSWWPPRAHGPWPRPPRSLIAWGCGGHPLSQHSRRNTCAHTSRSNSFHAGFKVSSELSRPVCKSHRQSHVPCVKRVSPRSPCPPTVAATSGDAEPTPWRWPQPLTYPTLPPLSSAVGCGPQVPHSAPCPNTSLPHTLSG